MVRASAGDEGRPERNRQLQTEDEDDPAAHGEDGGVDAALDSNRVPDASAILDVHGAPTEIQESGDK
jgi:hypothetical protein